MPKENSLNESVGELWLCNVRMSYTKDGSGNIAIVEDNQYYPFGLKHQGYSLSSTLSNELAGRLKFNGQEYEQAAALNMYEMDFRQYDPALGRFHAIDLLTEYMPNMSPYSFGFDNPLYFSDPTGLAGDGGPDETIQLDNVTVEGHPVKNKGFSRQFIFFSAFAGFSEMNGDVHEPHSHGGYRSREESVILEKTEFYGLGMWKAVAIIRYKYVQDNNGTITVDPDSISIGTSLDNIFSGLDTYSDGNYFFASYSEMTSLSSNGKFIIFRAVGTHHTGFAFGNPVVYEFTGVVNVYNVNSSWVHVRSITGQWF